MHYEIRFLHIIYRVYPQPPTLKGLWFVLRDEKGSGEAPRVGIGKIRVVDSQYRHPAAAIRRCHHVELFRRGFPVISDAGEADLGDDMLFREAKEYVLRETADFALEVVVGFPLEGVLRPVTPVIAVIRVTRSRDTVVRDSH